MKTKQLIILLAVVAVLLVVAVLKNKKSNADWRDNDGTNTQTILSEDFDTEIINAISIKSASGIINLAKGDKGWISKDRFDYPANIKELSSLIVDLTETKIAQTVPATKEQEADMKLTDDSGAITVALLDKDNKALKTIVFGKKHEKESEQPAMNMYGMSGNTPLGRYLKMEDGTCVLVANTFAVIDETAANWLDKDFFKITDIKSATLSENLKPVWTVSRETKSADFTIVGTIPDTKEPDSTKLNAIKNAFSWIRFNDVADPAAKPADIGMDKPKTLAVIDFDENIYTLTFGAQTNGKQYMKVSVAWNGVTVREPAKDEKPEDKAKLDADFAKKIKDFQDKAKNLNDKLSPWTYEVGTNALSSVDKTLDDLLKDKPAPKTEDKPAAEPAK